MPKVPELVHTNGVAKPSNINNIAPQLLSMVVDIDSLVQDPDNANTHPEKNMEALRASLTKYGQVHALLCRKATRVIVSGNGRWKAAKDLGWTKIAAHFVDINEVEAAGLGIVDNRSSALSHLDMDIVARIHRFQLECGDSIIGWSDDEIDSVSLMPDWDPTPQDQSEEAIAARPTTVCIKMFTDQRVLLESCLEMIKKRRSSNKGMTDAQALIILAQEWLH